MTRAACTMDEGVSTMAIQETLSAACADGAHARSDVYSSLSHTGRGCLLDSHIWSTCPDTSVDVVALQPNGLALGRFSVIYATPPCVITRRSPVQGSCAVPEHLCLTRPYVPKARTLALQPRAGFVRRADSYRFDLPARCRCRSYRRAPGARCSPIALFVSR